MQMSKNLMVASSPHVRDRSTTASIMLDVIIALLPALVASVLIYGTRALVLVGVCVVSCVAFEWLFEKLVGRECTISDLSAVVTGMLLAYNLPPQLPLWMAVFGSLVAIVVAKQLFGGIGQNFANPAIVGRIALLISFTTPMTTWLLPEKTASGIDLVSGATPLALVKAGQTEQLPELMDMFLGLRGGCIGETCTAALLLGGLYLIARKVITPTIPLAFIGTVAVLTTLMGANTPYHLLGGGLMLGSFFMATDYSTSPPTEKGRLLFGIGCGVLTVVIRMWSSLPEGVSYAILLMNILAPHIASLTMSKPFGGADK